MEFASSICLQAVMCRDDGVALEEYVCSFQQLSYEVYERAMDSTERTLRYVAMLAMLFRDVCAGELTCICRFYCLPASCSPEVMVCRTVSWRIRRKNSLP
jgi:hypothetical protein